MGQVLGPYSSVPPNTQIQVVVVGNKGVGKTALMDYVRSKMYPKNDIRWLSANKENWSFSLDITKNLSLRLTEEPDTEQPSHFNFETADVCIMCFSIVDERTYQAIVDKWNPASGVNFDLRVLLVGTQVDLRPDPKKKAKPAAAPKIVVQEELKKASEHPKYCLSQMPSTVMLHIFSYLSLPDLYAAMRVSKRWQKIANGRYIWKNRVRRRGKAITPAQGESMRDRIAAEKYFECSATTGSGMKSLVEEVLKQGLQSLHESSTLGGAANRRKRRDEKKTADKGAGANPKDEKGKARDPKQTNGTSTAGGGEHKLADDAKPAAAGAPTSAEEERKDKDKAAPATDSTSPK